MPGVIYHMLHALWRNSARYDEYIGTLINAYLARGGSARGVRAGTEYMDIGTIGGYRAAQQALSGDVEPGEPRLVENTIHDFISRGYLNAEHSDKGCNWRWA